MMIDRRTLISVHVFFAVIVLPSRSDDIIVQQLPNLLMSARSSAFSVLVSALSSVISAPEIRLYCGYLRFGSHRRGEFQPPTGNTNQWRDNLDPFFHE